MRKFIYPLATLIFAVVALAFSSIDSRAQSHQPGTLSFQLGFDAGVHASRSETTFMGEVTERDTSGTGTTMGYLTAHYNFARWLSAGFHFSGGSYIEDPENAEADGNTIRIIALDLRLYPVNKENFNWYAGLELGASALEINRRYTFLVAWNAQYNYGGSRVGLYTGINWYFANFIGLNTSLGYTAHSFQLSEYLINGETQSLEDIEQTLVTAGVHFRIGLSFKIN